MRGAPLSRSLVRRSTLGQKCREAFTRVVGREQCAEGRRFELTGRGEIDVEAAMDRALTRGHCERRLFGDAPSVLLRLRQELLGGDDSIHETDSQRLLGADRFTRIDELTRTPEPDTT